MHKLLNKKTTKALHGIAILMMVYHHIFINGNTWYVNEPKSLLNILNVINLGKADTFQQTVAWFTRICVSIFAFTSGYGIYVQLSNKVKEKMDIITMYRYCFKRIFAFYKKYLLVFVIFVGLEYYLGAMDVGEIDAIRFIESLLGLSYFYNDTWWYVSQYYAMVLCAPIIFILLNKIKKKETIILSSIFALSFVVAAILGQLPAYIKFYSKNIQTQFMMFLIIFIEGMFISKYNLADIIGGELNRLTSAFVVIVIFVLRIVLIRAPSDSLFDLVLIVPFVIALAYLLKDIKDNNLLVFLGNYSTYMWFVHSYFYAYIFFDLVIQCDQSIFVYIQTVLYSLATAIMLTGIENFLTKKLKK